MKAARARRCVVLNIAAAALALAAASCALAPRPSPEDMGVQLEKGPSAAPPVRPQEDSGLSQKAFADLPEEARSYLERLARAFAEGDSRYLTDQGERNYAARARPRFAEDEYLALLYRIGPYAAETPADPNPLPKLVPSEIRGIRYTGWEEQGPLLEIRARISLKSGAVLPGRILLLWRLAEPKILGTDP